MASFKSWLSVRFKHRFYSDNACRVLKAVPSASTEASLNSVGAILKHRSDGFDVMRDEHHPAMNTTTAPTEFAEGLVFYLRTVSEEFHRISPGLPTGKHIRHFSTSDFEYISNQLTAVVNSENTSRSAALPVSGTIRLSKTDTAASYRLERPAGTVVWESTGPTDQAELPFSTLPTGRYTLFTDGKETQQFYNDPELGWSPTVCVLEFPYQGPTGVALWGDSGPADLHAVLQYETLDVAWRYRVKATDLSQTDNWRITNGRSNGEELFTITTNGDGNAVLFESKSAFPLQEKPKKKLQLRSANTVLVPQLPCPTPLQVRADVDGGHSAELNIYL